MQNSELLDSYRVQRYCRAMPIAPIATDRDIFRTLLRKKQKILSWFFLLQNIRAAARDFTQLRQPHSC